MVICGAGQQRICGAGQQRKPMASGAMGTTPSSGDTAGVPTENCMTKPREGWLLDNRMAQGRRAASTIFRHKMFKLNINTKKINK